MSVQGHAPTNYSAWMRASASYTVAFEEYYEPYVLAHRSCISLYDERFRGYGLNKISHIYSAAAAGFVFKVSSSKSSAVPFDWSLMVACLGQAPNL